MNKRMREKKKKCARMKLKAEKKPRQPSAIKRQANQGLEGIIKGRQGILSPGLPLSKKDYEFVLN